MKDKAKLSKAIEEQVERSLPILQAIQDWVLGENATAQMMALNDRSAGQEHANVTLLAAIELAAALLVAAAPMAPPSEEQARLIGATVAARFKKYHAGTGVRGPDGSNWSSLLNKL